MDHAEATALLEAAAPRHPFVRVKPNATRCHRHEKVQHRSLGTLMKVKDKHRAVVKYNNGRGKTLNVIALTELSNAHSHNDQIGIRILVPPRTEEDMALRERLNNILDHEPSTSGNDYNTRVTDLPAGIFTSTDGSKDAVPVHHVIRNKKTKLFWGPNKDWVEDPETARPFGKEPLAKGEITKLGRKDKDLVGHMEIMLLEAAIEIFVYPEGRPAPVQQVQVPVAAVEPKDKLLSLLDSDSVEAIELVCARDQLARATEMMTAARERHTSAMAAARVAAMDRTASLFDQLAEV